MHSGELGAATLADSCSMVRTCAQVHEGMMSAATFVHCNTSEALAEAARRFPGWPLLLTGHSMGGAPLIHYYERR